MWDEVSRTFFLKVKTWSECFAKIAYRKACSDILRNDHTEHVGKEVAVIFKRVIAEGIAEGIAEQKKPKAGSIAEAWANTIVSSPGASTASTAANISAHDLEILCEKGWNAVAKELKNTIPWLTFDAKDAYRAACKDILDGRDGTKWLTREAAKIFAETIKAVYSPNYHPNEIEIKRLVKAAITADLLTRGCVISAPVNVDSTFVLNVWSPIVLFFLGLGAEPECMPGPKTHNKVRGAILDEYKCIVSEKSLAAIMNGEHKVETTVANSRRPTQDELERLSRLARKIEHFTTYRTETVWTKASFNIYSKICLFYLGFDTEPQILPAERARLVVKKAVKDEWCKMLINQIGSTLNTVSKEVDNRLAEQADKTLSTDNVGAPCPNKTSEPSKAPDLSDYYLSEARAFLSSGIINYQPVPVANRCRDLVQRLPPATAKEIRAALWLLNLEKDRVAKQKRLDLVKGLSKVYAGKIKPVDDLIIESFKKQSELLMKRYGKIEPNKLETGRKGHSNYHNPTQYNGGTTYHSLILWPGHDVDCV